MVMCTSELVTLSGSSVGSLCISAGSVVGIVGAEFEIVEDAPSISIGVEEYIIGLHESVRTS